jgi:tetratricopeptide (TPR) repeat protein
LILIAAALLGGSGCSELRGRRAVREGNRLFHEGRFGEAVAAYQRAEGLTPGLPTLWRNKGLTCQKMIVPGAKTPQNAEAIACALTSFQRLRELQPADPRGDQLYVQTLFDADRFETLVEIYGARLRKNPADVEAVNGMVQVYSRWNRVEEAVRWYQRKAALQPKDPEAQYAVGVYIWQQLFQRGGGPEQAAFDPRPDPDDPRKGKTPPAGKLGDITGAQRAALADLGIRYLERAVALRPRYDAAMTYLNLLYRQKSFAFFHQPAKWQECVDAAESWRRRAATLPRGP